MIASEQSAVKEALNGILTELFIYLFLLKYSWFTVLLVSGIQQSDSYIYMYVLFHYGLLQDSEYS